jgi:hypothetical protein
MTRMITNGQKKIIWTIVRKHGLDEEEFREWLYQNFETRSTRKLADYAADEVIKALKALIGAEYRPRPVTWGITMKQMAKAKALAGELGWDDPKRLDGMVKKMFDPKNRPELLTKTEGTKLIIALEKMVEEGMGDQPVAPTDTANGGAQ